MAVKLSEHFRSLATKSGQDIDDDVLKSIIDQLASNDMEIPEDIINKINDAFLTMESAKNNPDLNKHFKGKYLDSVDVSSKRALKEAGVSEDILKQLESEPDTLKRLNSSYTVLNDHFKNEYQSTSTGSSDEDKTKIQSLQETIKGLETTIQEATEKYEVNVTELKSGFEKERISMSHDNIVANYTYAENFSKEDVAVLIRSKLDNSPYIFRKEDAGIKIFQKDNPDLVAMKDNKELTYKELIEDMVSPYTKKNGGEPLNDRPIFSTPNPQNNGRKLTVSEQNEQKALKQNSGKKIVQGIGT